MKKIKLRKPNKYEKKDFPDAVVALLIGNHEVILNQVELSKIITKGQSFLVH